MKRKISIMISIMLITTFLYGCAGNKIKFAKSVSEYPRLMTIVDKTAWYVIYVHDETGVMYISISESICVMVDKDGNPLIYDNWKDVSDVSEGE